MKYFFLICCLLALPVHSRSQSALHTLTDQQVIAMTILGEARGEGQLGMYAVACVIAQRAENRKLSARKVCLQKYQFSCWLSSDLNRRKLPGLLKTKNATYALYLAKNIGRMDRAFMNYADHYYAGQKVPYWARGKRPVKRIGAHTFFRLRK